MSYRNKVYTYTAFRYGIEKRAVPTDTLIPPPHDIDQLPVQSAVQGRSLGELGPVEGAPQLQCRQYTHRDINNKLCSNYGQKTNPSEKEEQSR